MSFDTDKIHIQVGVLFNNEKCIVSIPHLRKIQFTKYILKNIQKIDPKKNTKTKFKTLRV